MDFNKQIERFNTGSVKWDMLEEFFGDKDILPMWVADMDFDNAKEIKEAIKQLVETQILGYTFAKPSFYNSIIDWQKDRHDMVVSKEDILLSPGVLSSIAVIIQALTEEGDGVLIHDPVYTPFAMIVEKNNRTVYRSTLVEEDNLYKMDFNDIEKQMQDHSIKLFLLSNPHNPGGRVWSKDELLKLTDLCRQYRVILISDEIHSDLVFRDYTCISPVTLNQSYKDSVITLHSATKTFNIAGVKASFMIIYNEDLRNKVVHTQEQTELSSVNSFGLAATEAAFSKSREWHKGLMNHLETNRTKVIDFFNDSLQDVSYMAPQATYLFWFDASTLNIENNKLKKTFAEVGKVALNDGISYGPGGKAYMRLNFAVPESMLEDGLKRIKRVFDTV